METDRLVRGRREREAPAIPAPVIDRDDWQSRLIEKWVDRKARRAREKTMRERTA